MSIFLQRAFLAFAAFCFLFSASNVQANCTLGTPVLSVPEVSSCKISISWTGDPGTAYYKVKYKVKGQSGWIANVNVGQSTSYSIEDLSSSTKYIVEIIPYCPNNESGSIAKKTIQTAACGIPDQIAVSNVQNTSATITWVTCSSGNETFVRLKIKGTTQWTIYSAGTQSFITLTGLIPNTKYQFQVNACDISNNALWSPTQIFQTTNSSSSSRPNVLLIYLDDCRYDVFGPNGGPSFFNSPAINSIAEEGANFRWCFPALSLCSPSRASIVSGLYPHHHGVYSNELADTFPHTTLAQIMHDNDYYTGFVGKYGFEKFPVPGYDYYCNSSSDEYWNARYQYNSKSWTTINGHKTEIFTDKALEFLNAVPDGKKFMLFLAHKAPHVPYDPRPEDEGVFNGNVMPFPPNYASYTTNIPSHYYDCNQQYPNPGLVNSNYKDYFELLNGAEWSVDTILNYLQSKHLMDSTLIIFTSDNGILIGEHELGGKELALEPSLQLPMFIRYPKWFAPNTVITKEMAMNIDIAPTVLDAAGIPNTYNMDGMSMRTLANGTAHRKELFYEFFYRNNCNPTFQAVRDFQYKYVHNQCASTSEEFYDLVNDSLETQNLIYDPNYASLVMLYKNKLDSLKEVYDYVNISNVTLNCSLLNIDSSAIVFKWSDENTAVSNSRVYPNPVGNYITLEGSSDQERTVQLVITNMFGEEVFKEQLHLQEGSYQHILDIASLPPGTYMINMISNGKHESLMFVRQ